MSVISAVGFSSDQAATWLALLVALAVAWRISRGGGGSAIQELSEANRVLERRVNELGKEVRDLRIENAQLREQTNFAVVMEVHEAADTLRADNLLAAINQIYDRIILHPVEGGKA